MSDQLIVQCTGNVSDNKQIECIVDDDIKDFDSFFQEHLKNDPMNKAERAIIKTYVGWKLGIFQKRG